MVGEEENIANIYSSYGQIGMNRHVVANMAQWTAASVFWCTLLFFFISISYYSKADEVHSDTHSGAD